MNTIKNNFTNEQIESYLNKRFGYNPLVVLDKIFVGLTILIILLTGFVLGVLV